MLSMFREENGLVSMRRVLAFIFGLATVGIVIFCVAKNQPWQVVIASGGLFGGLTALLLFFTTWADISSILGSIKK